MSHVIPKPLVATLLLTAYACAGSPPPADRPEASVSADALMNEFVTAWERDDAAAVRDQFAPNAVVVVGRNAPAQGIAAIDRGFIQYNQPNASGLRVTPLESRMRGDLAFQTGTYTQRIDARGESPYTQTGRHTFVWERQADGEWKLASVLIDPDPAPVDLAAEEAAIRQLDQRWGRAVTEGDVSVIRNLFAPEARFLAPNAPPIVGREAIGQAFAHVLGVPGAELRFGPSDVVVGPSGEVAYTTGIYTYAFDTPQGRVQDRGKNLIVWRKIDGEWKVVQDMFNSDVPMQ